MNNPQFLKFIGQKQRLDKYLVNNFPELSRNYITNLIKNKNILVNNKAVKCGHMLTNSDEVLINKVEKTAPNIKGEDIEFEIVYEDNDIIIVNKPQGIVVHPCESTKSGTIVNGLIYKIGNTLSGINGILRPGIVHRIDKDTSGLIVVAKTDAAHRNLSLQFENHTITREYRGIVRGKILENLTIDKPIGRNSRDRKKMTVTYRNSKQAITHVCPIEILRNYTYCKFILETGRTHQIRVHMKSIGHPILGDKMYGITDEEFNLKGQLLHAQKLGFIHPTSNVYMKFTSELPKYFLDTLKNLNE